MKIIETILKEIQRSPKSRAEISRDTGITEGQLHRIVVKGQSMYCETADKLLEYFGYALVKTRGRSKK